MAGKAPAHAELVAPRKKQLIGVCRLQFILHCCIICRIGRSACGIFSGLPIAKDFFGCSESLENKACFLSAASGILRDFSNSIGGVWMMVNIHNIMEEQVISRVNQLYEQVKDRGTSWLSCDCENCRLDTINYVLNRIPPRYVVSGRGVAHNTAAVLSDSQLAADIDRIGLEGMRLVSMAKRPYHKTLKLNGGKAPLMIYPAFHFPTFTGAVYDGSTFEPLIGANVLLKHEGETAVMMDSSWANPCTTFKATLGNYTFWVAPEPASKESIAREFTFTVEISAEGYLPVTYSFDVPLVSEMNDRRELNSVYSLKIQDLFLFRDDVVNEQE